MLFLLILGGKWIAYIVEYNEKIQTIHIICCRIIASLQIITSKDAVFGVNSKWCWVSMNYKHSVGVLLVSRMTSLMGWANDKKNSVRIQENNNFKNNLLFVCVQPNCHQHVNPLNYKKKACRQFLFLCDFFSFTVWYARANRFVNAQHMTLCLC